MQDSQLTKDIARIHTLVQAIGYGDGLSEAHRILGTPRYHAAFGPWEIQDRIISRHVAEEITVNHWTETPEGTWVAV